MRDGRFQVARGHAAANRWVRLQGPTMTSGPRDTEDWRPPEWARRHLADEGWREANATRVLVVDDDEMFRRTTARVLRAVGYTVTEAADGADALRLLNVMRFDVVLLDLRLPPFDGIGLVRQVRHLPPVISVSGYALDDDARTEMSESIVAHLRKPVPPQQLLDTVETAVRPRHVLREEPEPTGSY